MKLESCGTSAACAKSSRKARTWRNHAFYKLYPRVFPFNQLFLLDSRTVLQFIQTSIDQMCKLVDGACLVQGRELDRAREEELESEWGKFVNICSQSCSHCNRQQLLLFFATFWSDEFLLRLSTFKPMVLHLLPTYLFTVCKFSSAYHKSRKLVTLYPKWRVEGSRIWLTKRLKC